MRYSQILVFVGLNLLNVVLCNDISHGKFGAVLKTSMATYEQHCLTLYEQEDMPLLSTLYDDIATMKKNSTLREWIGELHLECYWMFRACPIYIPIREEEMNDISYWDYINHLTEVDPHAYVYLCEALEHVQKSSISRMFRSWLRLNEEWRSMIMADLYKKNPHSEFLSLFFSEGFFQFNFEGDQRPEFDVDTDTLSSFLNRMSS
jgi:hypothetical protein